ncbi:MAG: protein kinase domain-containing protein [Kofleriaceae bacterium]
MEGDETLREDGGETQVGSSTGPTIGRASTAQPVPRESTTELGKRYELGGVIGRGGMGEVRLARDTRIDREVAVKLMRGGERSEADLNRFFREARVQGVLEHPSVVPVHDLGIDANGAPYFVMKRLAGTTLADVLASSDDAIQARPPRRALLARLVDICFAIDFAHARGVIHRDLKPANIMLGDYGEAYVLDWGLARLSADGESLDGVLPLSGDGGDETQAGTLLGTPGYMSPEQARGEGVGRATDVFALGMVLYEILAGAAALPRGIAAIPETLSAPHHRPSARVADVPPELDDLCARATAADGTSRPTARELANQIQAYLDGDRDTARRRELAEEHAQRAQSALARILGDDSPTSARDDTRAFAMREAGRALALDPSNATAAAVLSRLLIEAPAHEIPVEAHATAEAERAEGRRHVIAMSKYGFLALWLITVVLFALPLQSYWQPVTATILAFSMFLVTHKLSLVPLAGDSPWFLLLLVLACALLFLSGVMFGPLLIMPIFTIGTLAGFLSQPNRFPSALIIVLVVCPIIAALGLEMLGVLPSTFEIENGQLILRTNVLDLTPMTTLILVAMVLVTQLINTIFIALTTVRVQIAAQDRVHAQTWHLKQLLPGLEYKPREKPRG